MLAVTFLSLLLIRNFVDSFLGNWLIDKFIVSEYRYYPEGMYSYQYTIDKDKLKDVITCVIITFTILIVCVSVLAAMVYSKIQIKRNISCISDFLDVILYNNGDMPSKYKKEYTELFNIIYKIKNQIILDKEYIRNDTIRKNELMSYLAHDLKTPLTVIIGYLNFLNEFEDITETQKMKCLQAAITEAGHLENLINEFFEIARYNSQCVKISKEKVDIKYMLSQISDEFYPLLAEKNMNIKLDVADDVYIEIDSEKMSRVFYNIIKNAINYSYKDTNILIKSEIEQKKYIIRITSIGKTIDGKDSEMIFEKLYRGEQSESYGSGGTGLGLAIAKEITLLHDGSITLESKDGKNSFVITLPV